MIRTAWRGDQAEAKGRKILINPRNRLRQGQAVGFDDLLDNIGRKVGEADEWV